MNYIFADSKYHRIHGNLNPSKLNAHVIVKLLSSCPLGVTPLFLATKDGNLQLTELLVKAGASVNACGAKQSISPLHWAAHKENDKMALYLIDNGADIMLADKEGRTPISMASPALAEQMIGNYGYYNNVIINVFSCC